MANVNLFAQKFFFERPKRTLFCVSKKILRRNQKKQYGLLCEIIYNDKKFYYVRKDFERQQFQHFKRWFFVMIFEAKI